MRSRVALMLVVFGVYNSGCSLIYTKGPQPGVQPPPPCTTDNTWPTTDTVLAAVSVAAVVAGTLLLTQKCPSGGCTTEEVAGGFVGGGLALGGIVGTAIFTPSAIVGYMRTADCRASLEPKPQQPASTPLPPSSFLLVPRGGCRTVGDAPRSCSAVALDEARVTVLH